MHRNCAGNNRRQKRQSNVEFIGFEGFSFKQNNKLSSKNMKSKIFKQILYVILLILSVNLVLAGNMTLQELIDSYDYSYSDGTLNATYQNDYMIDNNGNGINDT